MILQRCYKKLLEPIVSKVVSQEQFSFLERTLIHDIVGVPYETVYYIEIKKWPSFLVKSDLSKAYD
jgi:hypothetical protein